MDRMTQWRSVTGDLRLHGGTQLLDQLRIIRMRRRIGERGDADDPRGADGIPARIRRRRPILDLGIDIGRHDGNGIVAVAEDCQVRNCWGKSRSDGVSTSQKPFSGWAGSGDGCGVTVFIWRCPAINSMRFG